MHRDDPDAPPAPSGARRRARLRGAARAATGSSQNGWANQYYSAAVRSMLGSLHNFFFASSDPGGLITVDKPPLGLWLQTVSAAIFGFHPLSLLLPEALCGVLAVVVHVPDRGAAVRRLGGGRGGRGARGVPLVRRLGARQQPRRAADPADGARVPDRAARDRAGSWRWLLATAVLVGLAFNTKTLAAYLVLPGLAVGWLVCAPGSLRRRAALLGARDGRARGRLAGLGRRGELTPAVAAPLRRRHDRQLGAVAELRPQRPRARARRAQRPRAARDPEPPPRRAARRTRSAVAGFRDRAHADGHGDDPGRRRGGDVLDTGVVAAGARSDLVGRPRGSAAAVRPRGRRPGRVAAAVRADRHAGGRARGAARRAARPPPRRAARARRLAHRRGRRAERVDGDRAPLLRLGARPGGRGDGRRRRGRVRGPRPSHPRRAGAAGRRAGLHARRRRSSCSGASTTTCGCSCRS